MTVKERWTVYPLLLLAIGLALRAGSSGRDSTATGTLKAHKAQIESLEVGLVVADGFFCREFAVFDEAEKIIVHAGRVDGGGGGRIEIRDAAGRDSVAIGTTAESREGGIEFFAADGTPLGTLGPKKLAAEASATPPAARQEPPPSATSAEPPQAGSPSPKPEESPPVLQ